MLASEPVCREMLDSGIIGGQGAGAADCWLTVDCALCVSMVVLQESKLRAVQSEKKSAEKLVADKKRLIEKTDKVGLSTPPLLPCLACLLPALPLGLPMCLPTLIVAAASVSALDLLTTTPVCVPLRPAALELYVLADTSLRMYVCRRVGVAGAQGPVEEGGVAEEAGGYQEDRARQEVSRGRSRGRRVVRQRTGWGLLEGEEGMRQRPPDGCGVCWGVGQAS